MSLRRTSYDSELMDIGREGEDIAFDFLCWRLPGVAIKDVRDDPAWQQQDVDFLAHTDPILRVEAKSDAHIGKSGNVLFELARIHHTSPTVCAYLGWSVFSAADRLLVWNPSARKLFVFEMAALRAGLQRYAQEQAFDGKRINVGSVITDQLRTTVNVYVPLRYVPHRCYVRTFKFWRED